MISYLSVVTKHHECNYAGADLIIMDLFYDNNATKLKQKAWNVENCKVD